MDFVKNQIQRIQQQLSGLTASQRMLTAALVAIMVMTLVYWGRYAGTAEMEPLLDQGFQPNDISAITGKLQGKGIPFDVQGDRILVAAERKWEALADIAYAKLLPRNSFAGFDEMLGKLKPWASPSERDAMYNHAREGMCTQIIQRWAGVEHAAVMITAAERRSIGQKAEATATVDITMANGDEPDKRLIEAAAATVAGSTPGMQAKNVMVVVNGVHRPTGQGDLASGGGAGSMSLLETIQLHEQHRAGAIREILRDIPGVFVSVAVEVNSDLVEKLEQNYDKDGVISVPTRTKTTDIKTGGQSAAPAEDPGAVANTQLQIDPAGAGESTASSESTSEDENENFASVTTTKTKSSGGAAKIISAAVRVPRSYFWRAVKLRTPEGQTVDETAVDKYMAEQLPRIKASVLGAVGVANADAVVVESYADALPTQLALAGAAGTGATATVSIPTQIGRFGKEIALGGLALVSLFMVSMMVRKSAPAPVIAPPPPVGPPQPLVAGEAVAGEAGDGNPLLAGMELDEDAIVTQQMLDQVSTMVKDNPDAAASLVKRWLNRA